MIFVLIGIGVILLVILAGLRMDREYQRSVIFRLGRFRRIKGPGLYWIIPLIDQKVRVDIRTITVDLETQEAVTRDSVIVRINAVLYYRVLDPGKAIIAIKDYQTAAYQAALTILRNVIGQHCLDEVLKDRGTLNRAARQIIEEITAPWGLKIEFVALKDMEIPPPMQRVLAKEAELDRERRARALREASA